ncbi:MAG: SH3 domain-containing protein [Hyphomicrobiales bacterium]|nr:SH3 domain-containing protein [Hyphomicrobiales bacterium]
MNKLTKLIWLSFLTISIFWFQPLLAATIELKPELFTHLSQLKRMYPAQTPSAIAGSETVSVNHAGVVGSRQNQNVIVVSGVIKKGDADRLDKILNDWSYYYTGIVFNSPGGNFLEGLRLGKVIRKAWEGNEQNLGGVFVLRGSKCLSACALAFAGSVDPYHDQYDTRFIEEGAQLGFHMGILPKKSADQLVKADEMLSLSYDIVAEYTALIASNHNPTALLQEALKHRDTASFYRVDADITAWSLGFSPVSSLTLANQIGASILDDSLANKVCNTILAYGKIYKTGAEMEFGQFIDYHQSASGKLINDLSAQLPLHVISVGEIYSCQISIDKEGFVGVLVWRGTGQCIDAVKNSQSSWCIGKERKVWRVSTALLADSLGCPGGLFSPPGTNYFTGKTRTGIIKRDVNMRTTPSLKAGIVSQLAAGTKVNISDCRIADDSQGVWFAVSNETGKGWASARFVYEHRILPHAPLAVKY